MHDINRHNIKSWAGSNHAQRSYNNASSRCCPTAFVCVILTLLNQVNEIPLLDEKEKLSFQTSSYLRLSRLFGSMLECILLKNPLPRSSCGCGFTRSAAIIINTAYHQKQSSQFLGNPKVLMMKNIGHYFKWLLRLLFSTVIMLSLRLTRTIWSWRPTGKT